jgi:hypothetical protein
VKDWTLAPGDALYRLIQIESMVCYQAEKIDAMVADSTRYGEGERVQCELWLT